MLPVFAPVGDYQCSQVGAFLDDVLVAKNGVRNSLEMRIRDCFLYSLSGVMPPEAPTVSER